MMIKTKQKLRFKDNNSDVQCLGTKESIIKEVAKVHKNIKRLKNTIKLKALAKHKKCYKVSSKDSKMSW